MLQQMNIRPRFETEPVKDQNFTRTVAKHDGKTFSYAKKSEKGGYMVYFPQGHSIHVRTDKELKRLGFDRPSGFIDMESGEEVPLNMSLKERSIRKTKPSRSTAKEGAETLDELQAAEGDE